MHGAWILLRCFHRHRSRKTQVSAAFEGDSRPPGLCAGSWGAWFSAPPDSSAGQLSWCVVSGPFLGMPFDASCEIKEHPPHAYDHGHLAMTYGLRTLTVGVHVNSPHGVVRRPSAMPYAHPIKLGATRTYPVACLQLHRTARADHPRRRSAACAACVFVCAQSRLACAACQPSRRPWL